LTDSLGGAKYEKNKMLCAKTQKSQYFSNSGEGAMPSPPPGPPNDVPAYNTSAAESKYSLSEHYSYFCGFIWLAMKFK